jgi:lysine decarboxylase
VTPPVLRLVPTAASSEQAGETPLVEAAERFLRSDVAHFCTPGHKRRSAYATVDPLLAYDIPHITGLDDAHGTRRTLQRAEQLAARAFDADWTRFSVQGSTHPNQAMLLAAGAPGDEIVMARTAHKSSFFGLVQSGLRPVWVTPDVDESTGLALGVPASRIAETLRRHPAARAVMLVEPSYVGLCSDLEAIAEAVHSRRAALLVDQAWGAHLGFHPALPRAATARGADAVSMSVHKTLTAFTQGSLLHACDRGFLDLERLAAAFDGLLTTSPSGAILASIDRARALMARDGERLLERALELAETLREAIDGFEGARCVGLPALAHPSVHGRDPLKIVIDLGRTGADGFAVERDLEAQGVRLEMVDRRTLVPLLTIGDDERSVARLASALRRSLRTRAASGRPVPRAASSWRVVPEQVLTPREAFFARHERVRLEAAAGRVAAEIVAPYPPGIPTIAPGEVVTRPLLDALREEAQAGTRIAGASDPTLATLLVVARR